MICNINYLADILRVCEIKDLIWVMRFQSPLVYNLFQVFKRTASLFWLRNEKNIINMIKHSFLKDICY